MPTSTRRKRSFYGGFPANPCRFPILHRRGGRPCPPAGNARFHGNPMRNRNILMGGQSRPPLQRVLKTTRVRQKSLRFPFRAGAGRCGHRPLQIATKNQRISRADRVVRPYKGYEKPRRSGEKSPRFPFRTVAGRCGHRPLQIATKNQRISRADRGVRPYEEYEKPRASGKNRRILKGGQSRPPLQAITI